MIALSELKRSLYNSDMQLGSQAFANGEFQRVEELVRIHTPKQQGGNDDLRSFEWHHSWRLCHQERATLIDHEGPGRWTCVACSPADGTLAAGGDGGAVRRLLASGGGAFKTTLSQRRGLTADIGKIRGNAHSGSGLDKTR